MSVRSMRYGGRTLSVSPSSSTLIFLGLSNSGLDQVSRAAVTRPVVIPDGDDLGLRPLTRKIEQLPVPAELATAASKATASNSAGKELPTEIDTASPRVPPRSRPRPRHRDGTRPGRPARKPSPRPCGLR